jgi:hypothetical protein
MLVAIGQHDMAAVGQTRQAVITADLTTLHKLQLRAAVSVGGSGICVARRCLSTAQDPGTAARHAKAATTAARPCMVSACYATLVRRGRGTDHNQVKRRHASQAPYAAQKVATAPG